MSLFYLSKILSFTAKRIEYEEAHNRLLFGSHHLIRQAQE
jgi:hypothetical protein